MLKSRFRHRQSVVRRRLSVVSCQLLILLLFAGRALGRDEQYRFTLDFGYRWQTDLRGSQDLYRSQLNLGQGPKLFAGNFFVAAPQGSNQWLDRFDLRMNGWGGEPYNTMQVRATKAGFYELRFDYQNTQYFNAIPSFANPFYAQGNLLTQHKYDISQRVARVQLTLLPQQRISPYLAFQHSGRQGPIRTTLAADGDEFVLQSDINNNSEDFQFGATFKLPKFSLLLEQGFRWYGDTTSFTDSGSSTGNSTRLTFGRDITLSGYQGRTDVSVTVPFSTGIAFYQPYSWLSLRGKVAYSNADLDSSYSEQLGGTLFSTPLSSFYANANQVTVGRGKQPSLYADFSAEWQPWEQFRLMERLTARRFHVSGSALTNATFLRVEPVLEQGIIDLLQTSKPFETFLAADFDTQEVEGFYSVVPRLVVRLGHRYEARQIKVGQRLTWDRNVLVSGVAYDFSPRNRVSLEYEFGRTNQPILRTDPVDFNRLRVRGRLAPLQSLEVNGSVTLFDNDDDRKEIDLSSRTRDYSLQVNYTPGRRVSVSAEYERNSTRSNMLFIVPQTFLAGRSLYREKGDSANVFVSMRMARNATLSLGYSVLASVGNFPINYHRPLAKVEVPLGERLIVYGQWNFYDYNEKLSLLPQDYGVHLAVFGFRVMLDRK